MALTVDPARFKYDPALAEGVKGKRILISGAGKDGGLGQAFALAAGMNGAQAIGVHFHRSYDDGLDLVDRLQAEGVNAFPIQADVTNTGDLWATRSYIIDRMGGVPDMVICNSGLSESGYSFGRSLREVEGEATALRRARVRKAFVDNLAESTAVLDTKIVGFLAMTHLWSGEAVWAKQPIEIVYISSRQAIDPGSAVPGYSIANWAVLQLPQVLKVNLGRLAESVTAFSVLYPFVRTGMTDEYAGNERVFGRWQPRMLETHEAAEAFLQLLSRPKTEIDQGMFEVMVDADEAAPEGGVKVTWQQVRIEVEETVPAWSQPLAYGKPE
jgi:NAD(P)-dependent dehydrogenase (short-subunit alcohol dehydrogenase family)